MSAAVPAPPAGGNWAAYRLFAVLIEIAARSLADQSQDPPPTAASEGGGPPKGPVPVSGGA